MHKKSSDPRPINLNLFAFRFPITAITSILHRISGFVLFLSIPLALWAWQLSLQDYSGFVYIKSLVLTWYVKLLVWLLLVALAYHIAAGVRHLLMDAHIGDTKRGGRIGAYSIFVVSAVLAILLGVYLW